jgi:hypothetical protein
MVITPRRSNLNNNTSHAQKCQGIVKESAGADAVFSGIDLDKPGLPYPAGLKSSIFCSTSSLIASRARPR